ncbi:nuclear GTP-binding protein nug1 [Rhodotorula kratochvilovae]
MVKIRKKTSNRTTTRMRAKVKHKVAESNRKQKKHAKTDPTWKSNKPKEIGIPNSFPYKDQLLAEAQAEKARVEAEKLARREAARQGSSATLASTAALAAALAADAEREEDDEMDEDVGAEKQVQDASLKLHAKSLRKVLEMSDVVIEVLDARDPVGTRCRAVERELKSLDNGRKKLVLVLNKIDLVPPHVVQAWLAHLRLQAPTIPFKSSTQQQRNHLSASSTATPQNASGSSTKPLMELIKGFRLGASSGESSSGQAVKHSLTIGLIGHPNVGKSSLINTLKRSKACSVAPTPGWTKEVQEVVIEKGVRVLDCPGVVVEMRGEIEGALKGMVRPEDVSDCKAPVEAILQRCSPQHLQMLYNIPHFPANDTTAFLLAVARAKGRLRKGGVPDLDGTARSILRDWVAGRIAYYTAPPSEEATAQLKAATAAEAENVGTVSEADVGGASLHAAFAPAMDLAALFGEADAVAFGGGEGAAGSAVVGKAVKMREGAMGVESEEADVGWVVGEEEEPAVAAMEDDLDLADLVDDEEADEDDDDDEMSEDEPAPAPTGIKGKRAAPGSSSRAESKIISVAPPQKKKKQAKQVSFSSTPLGPTGSAATAGASAPSAASANAAAIEDEAGDIALNKKLKRQAKKDKKRVKNAVAKRDAEVKAATREFGEDAELPSGPRKAQMVKAKGAVGTAYQFSDFFPVKGGKKADDDDEDM